MTGVDGGAAALTSFAPAGRLVLDGVVVGDERVLGAGGEWLGWLVARATVGLCAMQAGVIERALELTAEHARTRVQFGRPIGSFQAVAQRLADGVHRRASGAADHVAGRVAACFWFVRA